MTLHSTQKLYQAILSLLLVFTMAAVTLAGCYLVSGYRNGQFGETNENNTAYISFTEGFTNLTVRSRAGALHVASTLAKDLGLKDTSRELKVDSVHTFDGIRYYRMQQYHNGLPVFGRSVVLGADESGRSVSLNANTVPVSDRVAVTPTTAAEAARRTAIDAVRQETGEKTVTAEKLEEDDLCIYNFTEDGKDRLAYEVRCSTPEGSFKVFVDGEDGKLLDLYATTFGEAAICYDMEGKQLTASYNESLQQYVLGNESLGLYVFSLEGKNYYEGANGAYITSDDNVFGNSPAEVEREYNKATKLFRNLETIQRYFKNAYGVSGDKYLIGMYNDAYDNGNNSFATDDILWQGDLLPSGTVVGVISIGVRQDAGAIDLLAHEYMHRVEQSNVGLLYRGESGSIMEAYSDLFGELAEAGIEGKAPDWVHNGVRDLVNPEVHGYPAVYNGKYYVADSSGDNGAVHKNSTVLGHAAYLMWYGINGNSARRIDSQTLAKLWLTAMQKFNARETFAQCAATIYETAQSMGLSNEQIECVALAFQKAGLPVRDQDKGSASNATSSSTVTATTMSDPSASGAIGSAEPGAELREAVGDREVTAAETTEVTLPDAEPVTEVTEDDAVG